MNKIPTHFYLGGQRWSIVYSDSEYNETTFAVCDSRKCCITIFKKMTDANVNKSTFINSFWHEVTHAILQTYGYFDENSNEKLVCAMASGIAQVICTSEYGEEEENK